MPSPAKPKLDLFVSPPGTGKTTYCIDLFRQKVSGANAGIDSRAYFVLPSREHAERIQNLILKKEMPGLFNAHILSMNDLAPRLIAGSGVMHPTEPLRRAVIRLILEGAAPGGAEFRYFRRLTHSPGFHDLLTDAVKEFHANLIEPEDFEKAAQPLLKNTVFRSKFRDFSLILKNYAIELKRLGLEEPEADIRRLKHDFHEIAPVELVIFDGFYHFTRAQKTLIEYVARHTNHVVVTLTLPHTADSQKHLFEYPERTLEFLEKTGFIRKKDLFDRSYRVEDQALLHLENNIFKDSPDVYEGPAPITRFEAPGIRVETEMIAREIRRLYREHACHFSDICIILRSVGRYEKMIRSVFSEYEIPVFIHERFQLIQNGPVFTFYRFLKLILEGWKREDLFYLAKSSFFNHLLDPHEVLAFECDSLRENVTAGRDEWGRFIRGGAAAPRLKDFIQSLSEREDGFFSAQNVRQFAARSDEFLAALEAQNDPSGRFDRQDAQALACLRAVLQSARRFYESDGRRTFSALRFAAELSESIERGLFSMKPEGKNCVQVYDAIMAMPKEFKIVFIAGLLERSFPKNIAEDALFKDRERRVMNQQETFLEERLWRVAGERYFFYMALTRARHRLYLSYPAYDDRSRPTLPSFFLNEVERCFAPGTIRVVQKKPDDFLPALWEWETEPEVLRGIAESLFSPGDFPALLWNSRRGDAAMARIVEHGLSSGEALIRDHAAAEEFRRIVNIFSATRLETYETCAFKYFAGKILCLNEPPEGSENRHMGTILHNTLEKYFKSLSLPQKQSQDYLKNPDEMLACLCRILDSEMSGGPFRNEPSYRRSMFRSQMRQALEQFVRHEQKLGALRGLVPSHFEIEFGGGGLPYLEIEDKAGPIWITGKIDRIDTTPDGKKALVIDYKRSPRNLSQKIEKGLELQLPIYALAARKLLALEVMGVEHRILTKPKKEGLYLESYAERLDATQSQTLTPEEYARFLLQAERKIRQIVARLHAADISVRSKTCDYCEFDSVCRFEKWKIVYQNNPQMTKRHSEAKPKNLTEPDPSLRSG